MDGDDGYQGVRNGDGGLDVGEFGADQGACVKLGDKLRRGGGASDGREQADCGRDRRGDGLGDCSLYDNAAILESLGEGVEALVYPEGDP